MSSPKQTTEFLFGGIFFFLTLLFVGFYLWLSLIHVSGLEQRLEIEKKAIEAIKTEQSTLLNPSLRGVFEQYSLGVNAVSAVLRAREEVFTGQMEEEDYNPVVMLDYLDFFELFKKLLYKKAVISNLSLDAIGRVSFLVQTTSYSEAASQMAAFRYGLSEGQQKKILAEDEEEAAVIPPLFKEVEISNIGRRLLTGQLDEIPVILQGSDSSFDFIVQMKMNPEYFAYQLERAREEAEAVEEENQ